MHREAIRFFLPGPTHVLGDVLAALVEPPIGHRSGAFKELHAAVTPRLATLFRTSREVLLLTGSATLAMEMAVVSLSEERVLNLVCGAFSDRWHQLTLAYGRDADKLEVPWGEAIDPDALRRALRAKPYELVTVVHNETSTGVLSPLAEIARAVREESDALIAVDTVSSMAGAAVETDVWELDFVLTGSQKALALPPGLAFCSASDRALERAAKVPHRGYYVDLLSCLDSHRKSFTLTTPPIPQIRALDRQLDHILDEGLEARWRRHLELRDRTRSWAADRGIAYASAPDAGSPTVSCLRPPAGVDAPRLVARLAADGFVIGGGYGKWKPETFRIGHMGEVRMDDLERLLTKIDELLDEPL